MKRLIYLFLILTILAFGFSFKPQPVQALTADQTSMRGLAENQGTFRIDQGNLTQSFKPSKNRLEAVNVYVRALGGADANVTLNVWDSIWPGHLIGSATGTIPQTWDYHLYYFDNIHVTPGQTYYIVLQANSGQAEWKYIEPGEYPDGNAMNGVDNFPNLDFGFATYGHDGDPTEPAPDNSNPADNGTTAAPATTQGDGEAPSENVSGDIAAPTNLKAADAPGDKGGAIELTWDASTTAGISGYRIFRSIKKDSGFTEIGRTLAIVGSYVDKPVDNNKTYYYFVRAYNSVADSANSNIASAKAIDDIAWILSDYKANSGGLFSSMSLWVIIGIIAFIFIIIVSVGVGLLIFFLAKKRDNKK